MNCIEVFFMPATIPWAMLAMTIQSQILFKYIKRSPEMIADEYTSYLLNYTTFAFMMVYILYYYIKRRATTELYKLENESLLRFF